jgi:hypothetical protein
VKLKVLLTVHHSTVYQYSETNVMHFLFSLFATGIGQCTAGIIAITAMENSGKV